MRYKLYEAPTQTEITRATSGDLGGIGGARNVGKGTGSTVANKAKKYLQTESIPAQTRYRVIRDLLNDNNQLKKGNGWEDVQTALADMIENQIAKKAGLNGIGKPNIFKGSNGVDASLGGNSLKRNLFWQQLIEALKWEQLESPDNVFIEMLKQLGNFKSNNNLTTAGYEKLVNNFDWKKLQDFYNLYAQGKVEKTPDGIKPSMTTIISMMNGKSGTRKNSAQTKTTNKNIVQNFKDNASSLDNKDLVELNKFTAEEIKNRNLKI